MTSKAQNNPNQTTESDAAVDALRQDDVKRVMVALTSLLVGRKGDARGAAFNAEMIVIIGGPLATDGLQWLAQMARLNRRHVVHLSLTDEATLPTIGLARVCGTTVEIYESCLLCLRCDEDRVAIVPDSFKNGAFKLNSAMKLKRRVAPREFDRATDMVVRAYRHLLKSFDEAVIDEWTPLKVG